MAKTTPTKTSATISKPYAETETESTATIDSTDTGADRKPVCSEPAVAARIVEAGIDPFRLSLIREHEKKWANQTTLHYYFFDRDTDGATLHFTDGSSEWRSWVGGQDQIDQVNHAFETWKGLGIGLNFKPVHNREDAEVRIGFMRGDGSWSYVGRDVLDADDAKDPNKRTMNFGWDVTSDWGKQTALHEIGHTLGFPHEHQNPNAGIVWDKAAVYAEYGGPPNNWSTEEIDWNILRKLDRHAVRGSDWDPDSIMHYPIEPGLILSPPGFENGVSPAPGLSAADIRWVRQFYPPAQELDELPILAPFESRRFALDPGAQVDFRIRPVESRDYTLQTFGRADTVMVLFEERDGTPRYMDADDDSGHGRNAIIHQRLVRGRDYIVRIRLYFAHRRGDTAVLLY